MTEKEVLLNWIKTKRTEKHTPEDDLDTAYNEGWAAALDALEQFINGEDMSTRRAEEIKNEALERFYRRYMGNSR